ncbi:MAG: hypothetical protein CEE40_10130 [Chloroflexi bacterium B3_Chlor]|nr:MAG: hypothetical protein CEE40_10130 [Chloroflexi bacterium B3_Chlor]
MRKLHDAIAFLRSQLRAASSLVPLIALSLLVALALTRVGVTMAYPAFQSPISPIETPVVAPTEVPPAPPSESPEVPPTEPEVPPTAVPGEVGTPVAPVTEPEPSPAGEEPTREATQTPDTVEERSSSIRGLSWAVLIDTCVVGLSSLWLCCGGIALVLFILGVVASFVLRAA